MFSVGHQKRREGGGGEDNPMATECLQCQVMALGAPLEGRFFYSLIQLTGAIWEGQPTRKPAFAHHGPGELSRVLGGNGVRIANLSLLPPKQNIQGRMGPGLSPGPGHQGKERGKQVMPLGGRAECGTEHYDSRLKGLQKKKMHQSHLTAS